MHGPEEVAFADETFTRVEAVLGLPQYTVKLGIMDEERRTSRQPQGMHPRGEASRVAFINTGFLDRTGDEIHTSMEAGPFSRKDFIKRKAWITAYENQNVDIGLECGLSGPRADRQGHVGDARPDGGDAGSRRSSIPRPGPTAPGCRSPTAATLHALHYHQVDVFAVQAALEAGRPAGLCRRAARHPARQLPQVDATTQILREVENNAQGILGYVVRWIDQGVGCSKVPDINDVGLMEDRATCRISAQHIANWLHHGVVSEAEVMETHAADGRGGRPAERRRPALPADGARLRRPRLSGGLRSGLQGAGAAVGVYRADPPCAAAGVEAAGPLTACLPRPPVATRRT